MAKLNQKMALISVSDKSGLAQFGKDLESLGYTLLSTGGTLKFLRAEGINATSVSDYTGSPEILDGRVKTLHPKIHGGILARRDLSSHIQAMEEHAISPIDIVAVNLYPFIETIAKPGVTQEDAIENIDIGGPTMLRASAKNFKDVTVIVDPNDYSTVTEQLKADGKTHLELRQKLALKTFQHTASYDSAIDQYLSREISNEPSLRLSFTAGKTLRYGENNHQQAEFYLEPTAGFTPEENMGTAKQLHGKELSYNNLVDADAALESVKELWDKPAVSIIKHMNPCGFATGTSLSEAFEAGWEGDPVSAFGSIVALTRPVDLATAQRLKGRFVELIMAPGYADDALEYLKKKSKDLRIMEIADHQGMAARKVYKHILGGMLVQDRDIQLFEKWECVTDVKFPENKNGLAQFTWKACKHTKSNAIVMGYEYKEGAYQLLGMGPGQPNRIDSNLKLCQPRVKDNAQRIAKAKNLEVQKFTEDVFSQSILASDAFFPFDDNVIAAHEAGIKYIVQPGGSMRDQEVIDTCNRLGIAMIFTGMRHFRH